MSELYLIAVIPKREALRDWGITNLSVIIRDENI